MPRFKKAIISAAAVLGLMAGVTACQKTATVTMPICHGADGRLANLCLQHMEIAPVSHDEVHGVIQLRTRVRPQTFILYASLEVKEGTSWGLEDHRVYTIHDLPRVGHIRNLLPLLSGFCQSGKAHPWRIVGHIVGRAAVTGELANRWFYYPATRFSRVKVLFSTKALGKHTAGLVIKRCT